MHLKSVALFPERYPVTDRYPFNLPNLNATGALPFTTAVTFFVGENGTGKSTLLRAIAEKCGIHIWEPPEGRRFQFNPYEHELYRCISVEWADRVVPGSFFSSGIFHYFAEVLDEWADASPKFLDYFGGKSLMAQSHGQCHMSYFRSRYHLKGIYFLDEPETALSPKTQIEFLALLKEINRLGRAQFIIATHSPLLLAFPDSVIYSFDQTPVAPIEYEKTSHYQIFKSFLNDRETYLLDKGRDRPSP